MKINYFFIIFGLIFIFAGCSEQTEETKQQELYVSAASSLAAPLEVVEELYEKQNTTIDLVFNYGGSGTLVNQIIQGAPVDFLILASKSWMETAAEQGIVEEQYVKNLFANRLILAAPEGIDLEGLEELEGEEIEKIAVGNPESVPAGEYARQALMALRQWEVLQEKIVMTKSARQVATYIESKNVDAGFVFESDLEAFPALQVIEAIPEHLHEPIVYPAAAIDRNGRIEESEAFLSFLTSQEAQEVFEEYGFREIR